MSSHLKGLLRAAGHKLPDASRRTGSIVALVLFAVMLGSPAQAVTIDKIPPYVHIKIVKLYCGGKLCGFRIDPQHVESFQFDIQFNPAAVTLDSLTYLLPYAETAPPDLSNLAMGQINDIAGHSEGPPPTGNADLFGLTFLAIPGTSMGDRWFTVSASATDFVTVRDPATGQSTTFSGSDILGDSARCPEPAAWALLGVGLAGLGIARRQRGVAPKEVPGVA